MQTIEEYGNPFSCYSEESYALDRRSSKNVVKYRNSRTLSVLKIL